MQMRNWLALGRKLVDQFDMDASFQWVQKQLGYLTLSYWGFGVQVTTQFPNPFPLSLDAGALSGTVGPGIAFDPDGMLVQVLPTSQTPKTFVLSPSDQTNDRWDLLCLRYRQTKNTLIQKPSNPLETAYLNLADDFEIVVRSGTPSVTPAYPPKTAGDVILAGLRVPAGAVAGPSVAVDLSIRELAQAQAAIKPVIVQEALAGNVDGTNTAFGLSQPPIAPQSVIVFVDSQALSAADYLLTGQTVSLSFAPAVGQTVTSYYVANGAQSTNSLGGMQEVPAGTVDGINRVFQLTGLPADQKSTMVFVDGLQSPPTDWFLIQGTQRGSIYFTADATPQPGQSLSVFYFVNPATLGVAPAGTNAGGGSSNPGGGAAPRTEYPILSATDVANGYVSLLGVPAAPASVLLDVIGGGAQAYGTDFSVSGQRLNFSGGLLSGGDTPLQSGDRLRIVYWV